MSLRRLAKFGQRVYRSGGEDYLPVKIPFLLVAGVAFSFLFLRGVREIGPLKRLPQEYHSQSEWLFTGAFAFAFMKSPTVRAVSLMVVPGTISEYGKFFVQGFLTRVLFDDGPVESVRLNLLSLTGFLRCNLEIAANVTLTRIQLQATPLKKLLFDPLKDMAVAMGAAAMELKQQMAMLRSLLRPLMREIQDFAESGVLQRRAKKLLEWGIGRHRERSWARDKQARLNELKADAEEVEKLKTAQKELLAPPPPNKLRSLRTRISTFYEEKLSGRCGDIYEMALVTCRKTFNNLQDKCEGFFDGQIYLVQPARYLVCPLFAIGYFCDAASTAKTVVSKCKGDGKVVAITNDMTDNLVSVANSADQVKDQFSVDIQFRLNVPSRPLKVKNLRDVAIGLNEFFLGVKGMITAVLSVLYISFGCLFSMSMYHTYKFIQQYQTDFTFENASVSEYFRQIDNRQKERQKHNLLPLRKLEQKRVPSGVFLGFSMGQLIGAVAQAVGMGMGVLVIVGLNSALVAMLELIRRHGDMVVTQTGKSSIYLRVVGKGFIANMLRSIMHTFDHRSDVSQILDNYRCGYDIYQVERGIHVQLWLIVVLFTFFHLLKTFLSRGQLWACELVFRKRWKARVIWLYNSMLQQRKIYFSYAMQKLGPRVEKAEMVRDQRVYRGTAGHLWDSFGHFVMIIMPWTRPKCLLCDDQLTPEMTAATKAVCPHHRIHIFCDSCWGEVNTARHPQECPACAVLLEKAQSEEESEGETEEEENENGDEDDE